MIFEREIIDEARRRAITATGLLKLLLTFSEGKPSALSFDRQRGVFIFKGSVVTEKSMRFQLGLVEDHLARVIESYMFKLVSGEWSIETWKREMTKLLKVSYYWMALMALGPFYLSASAYTESQVKVDSSYLENFAEEIRSGKVPVAPEEGASRKLSDIQKASRRAKSYLRKVFVAYGVLKQKLMTDLGYTQAKRVLTAKESCVSKGDLKGCRNVAGKWMWIGEMPPIGSLVCMQYCKCYLVYR